MAGIKRFAFDLVHWIKRKAQHTERRECLGLLSLEPIFFEQLTSERRLVWYFKGQPLRRFESILGKRAETLDATVYALAARQLVGMSLDRR